MSAKSSKFRYPMSYPLNRANVKKFIAASAPDARDVVRKFIKATTHISFETFISYINKNLAEVVKLVSDGRPIFVYIDPRHPNNIYKSNYWIYLYIKELAKTKYNINIVFVCDLDNTSLCNYDVIMLVDDCIYSGNQMANTVERLTNYSYKAFNIILFVSFISEEGLNLILEYKNNNDNLITSALILPKNKYIIKPLSSFMTLDEMMKLEKYYITPYPADEATIRIFSKIALKKYPIYFDHKLADHISTFPHIYVGVVPKDDHYSNTLSLKLQIIDKAAKLQIMEKYGEINTEKYRKQFEEHMKLQGKYEEEFNKIMFVPLIINCEFDKRMAIDGSLCPPPPYKQKYDEFISIIKKVKQDRNLRSTRSLPSMRNIRSTSSNIKSPGSRISSRSLTSTSRKTSSASF